MIDDGSGNNNAVEGGMEMFNRRNDQLIARMEGSDDGVNASGFSFTASSSSSGASALGNAALTTLTIFTRMKGPARDVASPVAMAMPGTPR